MALFNLGKKKEGPCCSESNTKQDASSCNCGCECGTGDAKTARFIVLGACCQKSTDTFNNVKQAVKEMGWSDEVLNIGDPLEIAKYGVMQTPALVINGKVVSYGKLLKAEDVKKIFAKLGIQ